MLGGQLQRLVQCLPRLLHATHIRPALHPRLHALAAAGAPKCGGGEALQSRQQVLSRQVQQRLLGCTATSAAAAALHSRQLQVAAAAIAAALRKLAPHRHMQRTVQQHLQVSRIKAICPLSHQP